jgi:hypothetical protein
MKFTTGSSEVPVTVFVGVFAAVTAITWNAEWIVIALVLIQIGPKSAGRLHETLVKSTFNAPVS